MNSVGVIGLGYVGLPLAVEFAQRGVQVIGFDVDRVHAPGERQAPRRIEQRVRTPIVHVIVGDADDIDPGGQQPFDGARVTFLYNASTHVPTILAGFQPDNDVAWDGLRHDSRDLLYRTPGGAVHHTKIMSQVATL